MSKTGIAGIAEGRSDLFKMDPRKIVIREGWNSRDFSDPANIEHVNMLAASIREVGVREPLTGHMEDGKFIVTNGESRLRAVLKLLDEGVDIKTVPVQSEPRHASEIEMIASQFIRNSGKPFTPMENARLFSRLLDLGSTPGDIARMTGLTPERVAQIAKLNAVSESVKAHVQAGEITPTLVQRIQAKAASAAEVEEKVLETIRIAKADGKTKATPKHAKTVLSGMPASPQPAHGGDTDDTKGDGAAPKSRTDYRGLFNELMSYSKPTKRMDDMQHVKASIPPDRWDAMAAAAGLEGRF